MVRRLTAPSPESLKCRKHLRQHSHKKRSFFAFSRMVARAFPIDFGESGATLQGAFRVLDRILSLGVVSDSTGISPTQLPGDRLLARVDGTLVWSIHPESLINSDMPTFSVLI